MRPTAEIIQRHLRTYSNLVLEEVGFAGTPDVIVISVPVSEASPEAVRVSGGSTLGRARMEKLDAREIRHRVRSLRSSAPPELSDSLLLQDLIEERERNRPDRNDWFLASARAARVDDFDVCCLMAISVDDLNSVPRLRGSRPDHFPSSLVPEVVYQILHRAWISLASDPHGPAFHAIGTQSSELIRMATGNFIAHALHLRGSDQEFDHDRLLSSLSALPYEGRAGVGSIIAVAPTEPDVVVDIELKEPVDLSKTRAVRKLLEASDSETRLLMHGRQIYGFGRARAPRRSSTLPQPLAFNLQGRGVWTFCDGGTPLLQVRDGVARLPPAAIDFGDFKKRLEWQLPDPDVEKLFKLAEAAQDNRHGAMLIISADAEREAHRFSNQAWKVEPFELSGRLLKKLTDMDGGILVDEKGWCHAIGVILDGIAGEAGDQSRGSRFNNPLRYLDTPMEDGVSLPRAVVVVYSTDGNVDILPEWKARKERALIEFLIESFRRSVSEDGDVNEAAGFLHQLDVHRFYLSPHQCVALNVLMRNLDMEQVSGLIGRRVREFSPNPRMAEQLFLA